VKLEDIKDARLRERILKSSTSEDYRLSSCAQPQPAVCDVSARADQRKESHAGRFLVRVTSFRRRLLDPDNLCPKYFVDALRYAGIIPDDTSEDIELVIRQEKVELRSDERTELEITPLAEWGVSAVGR
jgi:hypothetical protein